MRYCSAAALATLRRADPARPYVVGQLGQSLDGRIATPTGASKYISGRSALAHLHRLRAAVDAVVVGVDTVIADDPQLSVRLAPGRSPARVVIDPSGRVPTTAQCLSRQPSQTNTHGRGAPEIDTLVIRATGAPKSDLAPGVEVIELPRGSTGLLAPKAIVSALAARGYRKILIEGGATTLSRAIAADVVDALHVTVSPIILGSGAPGLALPPIDTLDEALRPSAEMFAFDDGDVLFACDLRASGVARERAAGATRIEDPATVLTAAE